MTHTAGASASGGSGVNACPAGSDSPGVAVVARCPFNHFEGVSVVQAQVCDAIPCWKEPAGPPPARGFYVGWGRGTKAVMLAKSASVPLSSPGYLMPNMEVNELTRHFRVSLRLGVTGPEVEASATPKVDEARRRQRFPQNPLPALVGRLAFEEGYRLRYTSLYRRAFR
jgi:hypothetical protein